MTRVTRRKNAGTVDLRLMGLSGRVGMAVAELHE
jgi:hypothetical protein